VPQQTKPMSWPMYLFLGNDDSSSERVLAVGRRDGAGTPPRPTFLNTVSSSLSRHQVITIHVTFETDGGRRQPGTRQNVASHETRNPSLTGTWTRGGLRWARPAFQIQMLEFTPRAIPSSLPPDNLHLWSTLLWSTLLHLNDRVRDCAACSACSSSRP
jgi:hypothetical protein